MNKNILFLLLLIGIDVCAYIKIVNKGPFQLDFGYIENNIKWEYVDPNKTKTINTPTVKSYYVNADMLNGEDFVNIAKSENANLAGDYKITVTYTGRAPKKNPAYFHGASENPSEYFEVKKTKIKRDNKLSSSSGNLNIASSSRSDDNKKENRQRENSL